MIGMPSPQSTDWNTLVFGDLTAMITGDRHDLWWFLRRRSTEPPLLNASVARSGWSWGCSAFDFDVTVFPMSILPTVSEHNGSGL